MAIPIKNIYHLLLYAWDFLEEGELVSTQIDEHDAPQDLFASLLVNGIQRLIRIGIHQDYVSRVEEIPAIRGRLLIDQTLKVGAFNRAKTICEFDDFCVDTPPNQIVKATVYNLLRMKGLDAGIKNDLRRLYRQMSAISDINLNNRAFNSVQIHRNNRFYSFLISICQLIHDNTLLAREDAGQSVFRDFIRDEKKMNVLFENFVREFYKRKLKGKYRVGGERLSWQTPTADAQAIDHLPEMVTDITLTPRGGSGATFILDTKYYKDPLGGGKSGEKIHASNLYQMFAYLSNKRADDGTIANGIILYASTGEDFSFHYPKFHDFDLRVESLNLDQDWHGIERSLLDLIDAKNQLSLAHN